MSRRIKQLPLSRYRTRQLKHYRKVTLEYYDIKLTSVIQQFWKLEIESHPKAQLQYFHIAFTAVVTVHTGRKHIKCNNSYLDVHVTVHRDKFLKIIPTRCNNFSNLFWKETLHASDSSSVHHQEIFTVHTAMVYVI